MQTRIYERINIVKILMIMISVKKPFNATVMSVKNVDGVITNVKCQLKNVKEMVNIP